MVEPITLGVIVAFLASKALNRAGDEVVDAGARTLRRVVETLRESFSAADDEDALRGLNRLEAAPDSPTRVRELAALIEDRAGKSNQLRQELEELVAQAREAGVAIDSIDQSAIGDQNVQSAGLVNSEVNVRFDSSPPDRG